MEHAEPEMFRSVLAAHDPDGLPHTLIVTRRGSGQRRLTWLSLGATYRTTVVLDGGTVDALVDLLVRAQTDRT